MPKPEVIVGPLAQARIDAMRITGIDDIMFPDERHRRTARICEASIEVLDHRIQRIDQELERIEKVDDEGVIKIEAGKVAS